MNDEELALLVGEHLQVKAQNDADILNFMLRNASAEAWGKAAEAGLTPSAGEWVIFMNRHRTKRTATEAEAEEIIRLARAFCDDHHECCMGYLQYALFDPLWALHNLNHLARDKGGQAEI